MKPLKILIVNKFYYQRGGDCTAALSLEQLLIEKGNKVAIFSMQHPSNIKSEWDKYFPSYINISSGKIKDKIYAAIRIFHSREVKNKFTKLLDDFNPDIVHLHNIHSYLSPIICQIAHNKGYKVVWTLHDYKLICPSYTCLRESKPCEYCFTNKWNVIKYKCMKKSFSASILAWGEIIFWNKTLLQKYTHSFICPSHFLKIKMIAAGYSDKKLKVLHNFIYKNKNFCFEKEDYYCYIGRLSEEKGVDTLLNVAMQLPFKLKIVGSGPLLEYFKSKYYSPNIEFTGQLSSNQVDILIKKARLLVMPSLWYENNPFSIIEALYFGTPILGSNIGGIPELIKEGDNGFLFQPGNTKDLKDKIIKSFEYFDKTYNFEKISIKAQEKFSRDMFYTNLINIYNSNVE